MRVPLSWLAEFVELPIPAEELADRLTFAGLEVSAIHRVGVPGSDLPWDPDRIVVGQVQDVAPHPNADRLVLATVLYGPDRVKTVVTGAPNLPAGTRGQRVAFALEGAQLWDAHSGTPGKFTLKGRKVRGIYSDAMVCSERELGLSEDHEGVLLLDDPAPVGTPLANVLGDTVLEVEILANMARCLSIIGVAREVAALTGGSVRVATPTMPDTGEPVSAKVQLVIADPALSARYTATLLQGVTIRPSPEWVRRRLRLSGIRPINNVVDVTNYVMLEWGQPLHAFDYDVLVRRAKGVPRITVRPAGPGEAITTLDGVARALTPDRLLITDTAGPIAVAGVMGGAETEVTEATRTILLESANFHFVSIRKTTQALKLPSEASARFGRGVPPALALPAVVRATALMHELAGGEIARGVADCYPAPQVSPVIMLGGEDLQRILGMTIPMADVLRILRALDFHCEPAGGERVRVEVPPHRLDVGEGIIGVHDLAEEVARVIGYDRIPVTEMADTLPPQRDNVAVDREEQARDLLVTAGLQEIIGYRLTTPEREAALVPGSATEAPGYIRLANPISTDRAVMRRTLLPGLLEVMASNARARDRLWFFEIGAVYLPVPGALPDEPRRLAIGLAGRVAPTSWVEPEGAAADFFSLKGVVEAFLAGLHVPAPVCDAAEHPSFTPGRTARLSLAGTPVGIMGELHPEVRKAFDLPLPAYLADLDLEAILRLVPNSYAVKAIPRFPPVLEDIALVVDDRVPATAVAEAIRAAGGPLLATVRLFDLYRGEQLPAGKKSLAFSLQFQALDRTLTDQDVEGEKRRIVQAVEQALGARLRG
jgi:phenylalanyl-tRNA synthetase beta chain